MYAAPVTSPRPPEQPFYDFMASNGLAPQEMPIADGKIHRFFVEGDKSGSRNGWYVLYGDGIPAGAFGSWKNGEWHKWSAKNTETMTKTERAEYRKRIERAKVERKRQQKEDQAKAKTHAEQIWKNAKPAPDDHPYLQTKGIRPYGVRAYNIV